MEKRTPVGTASIPEKVIEWIITPALELNRFYEMTIK